MNSQSTPKLSSSFSVTFATVTSIITCREGMSSFFSAASMTVNSGGVATISSVFASLSATTWMLRTIPTTSAAPPVPVRGAGAVAAGCAGGVAGCPVRGWNAGGETIVPAGVPGATVGAAGAAAGAARPVNACVSSGPSFSARWFCRWKT